MRKWSATARHPQHTFLLTSSGRSRSRLRPRQEEHMPMFVKGLMGVKPCRSSQRTTPPPLLLPVVCDHGEVCRNSLPQKPKMESKALRAERKAKSYEGRVKQHDGVVGQYSQDQEQRGEGIIPFFGCAKGGKAEKRSVPTTTTLPLSPFTHQRQGFHDHYCVTFTEVSSNRFISISEWITGSCSLVYSAVR